ncbi:hypothetical protein AX15_007854 [Amanita polypyramis BW_CC]|nr:hypothetical protein AX15_007854 [Amanita polypyramis BW_CC]
MDAMKEDMPHVPGNGAKGRVDSWKTWSRWKRGLFSGHWYFKLFNLAVGLGSLATACLGMWGTGKTIKATFALSGAATSFSCGSPV